MEQQTGTGFNISPIFIIGIIIFILPTLLNIFNIHSPSWTFKVGLVVIVIGVIHTAFFMGGK